MTHEDSKPASARRVVLIHVLLTLATLGVFGQVARHDFIGYDDDVYVTDNPRVLEGLTPEGVRWAFVTAHGANWHPVTWLSHQLDAELFGTDPAGHHVVSLAIHLASTLLLFAAFRRMTGADWPSAFVAAFFALHPLHVESVAWVAERKDVLGAFFWMLTLWCYAHYAERPVASRYLAVVACFALGLLSKPMVVTLPFVLLLLDRWPLGRLGGRLWLEKLPLLALSAAAGLATLAAQRSGGAVRSLVEHPFSERLANALVSYVVYLLKAAWPADLAVFYPYPRELSGWTIVGSALLLSVLCAAALAARRRAPYLTVGWLWYVITLLPVIGLVQVGWQARADRYTYLPLIGISIVLAWGIPELVANRARAKAALVVAATSGLVLLAVTAGVQARRWADSETLFTHALRVTQDNDIVHYNLGLHLAARGRASEAIAQFNAAVRIDPSFADAHNNLGNALEDQGRLAEAIESYERAVRLDPAMAEAHYNLGLARSRSGQPVAAARHFEEALSLRPSYTKAHNNLGIVLIELGRTRDAIAHLEEALRIDPDSVTAHYNLGVVLASRGERERAAAHFEAVLRIDPGHADARRRLRPRADPGP